MCHHWQAPETSKLGALSERTLPGLAGCAGAELRGVRQLDEDVQQVVVCLLQIFHPFRSLPCLSLCVAGGLRKCLGAARLRARRSLTRCLHSTTGSLYVFLAFLLVALLSIFRRRACDRVWPRSRRTPTRCRAPGALQLDADAVVCHLCILLAYVLNSPSARLLPRLAGGRRRCLSSARLRAQRSLPQVPRCAFPPSALPVRPAPWASARPQQPQATDEASHEGDSEHRKQELPLEHQLPQLCRYRQEPRHPWWTRRARALDHR